MLWAWAWSAHNPNWKKGDYAYGHIPKSLCPYMRKLLFTIPYSPFLYVWRKMPEPIHEFKDLAIIAIAISFVVHGLVHLSNTMAIIGGNEPMPWWTGWAIIFGGALTIATLVIVGLLIIKGLSKGFDYIKCKRGDVEIKKPSTMCLVEDFIEAKHDKICPMIEFVDDDKDEQ